MHVYLGLWTPPLSWKVAEGDWGHFFLIWGLHVVNLGDLMGKSRKVGHKSCSEDGAARKGVVLF